MLEDRARQQAQHKEAEGNMDAGNHEDWDVSSLTKEEVHARLQRKVDAVIKRERAMSYAYSHQVSPVIRDSIVYDSVNTCLQKQRVTVPIETLTDAQRKVLHLGELISAANSSSRLWLYHESDIHKIRLC